MPLHLGTAQILFFFNVSFFSRLLLPASDGRVTKRSSTANGLKLNQVNKMKRNRNFVSCIDARDFRQATSILVTNCLGVGGLGATYT